MNKDLLRNLRKCVEEAESKYVDIIINSNEELYNREIDKEPEDYDYYREIVLSNRLKEIKNTKEELDKYIINNYGSIDNIYEKGIQPLDIKLNKEDEKQMLRKMFGFENEFTEQELNNEMASIESGLKIVKYKDDEVQKEYEELMNDQLEYLKKKLNKYNYENDDMW